MTDIKQIAEEIKRANSERYARIENLQNRSVLEPQGIEMKESSQKEKKAHSINKKPVTKDQNQTTIIESIRNHDPGKATKLIHVRLDEGTVQILGQLKWAAGIDMTQFVSFSINYVFENQPDLKEIIKKSLQNLEL